MYVLFYVSSICFVFRQGGVCVYVLFYVSFVFRQGVYVRQGGSVCVCVYVLFYVNSRCFVFRQGGIASSLGRGCVCVYVLFYVSSRGFVFRQGCTCVYVLFYVSFSYVRTLCKHKFAQVSCYITHGTVCTTVCTFNASFGNKCVSANTKHFRYECNR